MATYEGVVGVSAAGNSVAAHKALMHAVNNALLAVGCTLVEDFTQYDIESLTTVIGTSSATFVTHGTRQYELNDLHSAEYPVYVRAIFCSGRAYSSLSQQDTPMCRIIIHHGLEGISTRGRWIDSIPNSSTYTSGNVNQYQISDLPVYAVKKGGYLAFGVAPGVKGGGGSPFVSSSYVFFLIRREFDGDGQYLGVSYAGRRATSLPHPNAYVTNANIPDATTALMTSGFLPRDMSVNTILNDGYTPYCLSMPGWPEKAISAGIAGLWCPVSVAPNAEPLHQLGFYRSDLASPGDTMNISMGEQELKYKAIGHMWGFIPSLQFDDFRTSQSSSKMGLALEWE